ncbi:type VI secretion system protein TssA [Roseibium suaedae]|uniref:Type VI secretion system protein ImpA n=1 Tax=Roseibium suaedae TaxID=735517 RepID=A0A1M7P9I7_9HYPH|nr:type VI secretion system protein TssA [Roseibium suaedae]SHN13379.1 type VI secretion system protein ImpA [Roseibium suaedae]
MLNLDDLLQSFGDDAPCGEDMTYDAAFTTLELANQPGEERVVGDSVIKAEDPDFQEVIRQACELLASTKDLRIAVMLANAALREDGLQGLDEVLSYIRRCLEDYWDSVHPQLDEDDDNDPTMRVNAILGLTDRETVLTSLRLAPLTDSRAFGRFSLRDLLIADGEVPVPAGMDTPPTPQTVSAAFQDTDPETLASLAAAAASCTGHVKAIAAVFDAEAGAFSPDLAPLQKMLFDIGKRLSAYAVEDFPEADEEFAEDDAFETGDGDGAPSQAPARARAPVSSAPAGAITSPEDVKRTIDRILDYYARHEPSSPLPILLQRARRLINADFLTIMRDMAPLGVENVALIGGFEENEEENEID